ncbi:MAG TPA: M56 family metallopeptidase [Pirellulales bacterium]|nr:M56 family metallopeptidase [Pirellulales bacterium]
MLTILAGYVDDLRQSSLLFDTVTRGTALLVAAMLATGLLRRSSAAVRHRIWCLTFAALILLPALSATLPEWRLAVLPNRGTLAQNSPLAPPAEEASTIQTPLPLESDSVRQGVPLVEQADYGAAEPASYEAPARGAPPSSHVRPPSLAALWLIGALVAVLPLVASLVRTFSLRWRSLPINDVTWTALLDELCECLAMSRRVRLYENASSLMPMTWGILRPAVMLPRHAREWTDRLRRVVLLHELAHVKRCDVGFQLLGRVACALYWFHPLAWYALRRLRIERELACDDCVVLAGERATDYAADLLQIARSYRALPFAAAVAMAQRSNLEHRLRALFDRARSHLPVSTRTAQILLVTVLLLATTIAVVRLAPRAEAGDNKQSATDEAQSKDDDVITVAGIVINPQGKPSAGANVFAVRWYWEPHIPHVPLAETKSGADGRFTISFRKSQFDVDIGNPEQWMSTSIVATARGFAPAWGSPRDVAPGSDLNLRLAADDIPVTGRVVDSEGRPLAGVAVRVLRVDTAKEEDLDGWLAAIARGEFPEAAFDQMRGMLQTFKGWMPQTMTDANGQFLLNGIGKERVAHLELTGAQLAYSTPVVATRPMKPVRRRVHSPNSDTEVVYGAAFQFAAPATRPIVGVIRDAETHHPLAGVSVEATQFVGGLYADRTLRAVTDEAGRYRLIGLPKGKGNSLVAVPNDGQPYFMQDISVPDASGFEPIELDIELHRGIWITGRVTDKITHEPLVACVTYLPFRSNEFANKTPEFGEQSMADGFQRRYASRADGRYRLVGLPGRAIVGAETFLHPYRRGVGADSISGLDERGIFNTYANPRRPGKDWPNTMKEIHPTLGVESVVCDLELDPGQKLTLHVVDPEGKPLSGFGFAGRTADVEPFEPPTEESTIDVVNLGPDEVRTVTIRHPGRNLGKAVRVRLADHPTRSMTVVTAPLAKIAGRLVDREGDPVIAALIYPSIHEEGDGKMAPVISDKEGRFEVSDLATGCSYDLTAQGTGLAVEVSREIGVSPGAVTALGDVLMGREPTNNEKRAAEGPSQKTGHPSPSSSNTNSPIRGRVVDLEGRPVAQARVQVVKMWEAAGEGGKLDAWLADVRVAHDWTQFREAEIEHLRELPLGKDFADVLTDDTGRFELAAGGEERVVQLRIDVEHIESVFCRAVTRPIEPIRIPGQIRKLALELINPLDDFTVYGSSFEHAAAPGCQVEGSVRDESTGQPLAGVLVRAERWSGSYDALLRTTTDADGHYRLSGISARAKATQVVAMAAPDLAYIAKTLSTTLERPGDRATIDFGLERGVWIEGQVIDKVTGQGVQSSVYYHAWGDNPYLSRTGTWRTPLFERCRCHTDREGHFRLLALPGRGLLSVEVSGGYAMGVGADKLPGPSNSIRARTQPNLRLEASAAVVEVDVAEEAGTIQRQIELDPGRKRRGTVLGPDGEPLEGAHLAAGWTEHSFGEKRLDGSQFTVEELVPGRTRTVVLVHEARKLIGSIDVSGDSDEPLQVRLQPWAAVRGRVIDDEGKPRSDLRVVTSDSLRQLERVKPGEDGRFEFDRLSPGVKYRFGSMFGNAVTGWLASDVILEAGESRDLGDVVVESDGSAPRAASEKSSIVTLRGRVLDPRGKPLSGARLYLSYPTRTRLEPRLLGTSGDEGRFEFQVDTSKLDRSFMADPWTRARLTAAAEGYGVEWAEAAKAAEAGDFALRLVKDVPIHGRILSLEGQPVPGAKIRLRQLRIPADNNLDGYIEAQRAGRTTTYRFERLAATVAGVPDTTTSDEQGRFALAGFGAERLVELFVEGSGIEYWYVFVMTRETGTVVTSPDAQVRSKPDRAYGARFDYLAPPGRTIVGTVRERSTQKPIAGVTIQCIGQTAHSLKTDEKGHFELLGVGKADDYYLDAKAESLPYFSTRLRIKDTPGLEPITVEIELPRGIEATGPVTLAESGEPNLAQVEYYPLAFNPYTERIGSQLARPCASATCDDDGRYTIPILPGPGILTYRLAYSLATYGRYMPAWLSKQELEAFYESAGLKAPTDRTEGFVEVSAGVQSLSSIIISNYNHVELINPGEDEASLSRDVKFALGRTLKAKVVGPDGQPASGAKVQGIGNSVFQVDDLDGSEFTIAGLNPRMERRLIVQLPDKRLGAYRLVRGDEEGPIEVRLQPCGSLVGRLVDADGEPVAKTMIGVGRPRRLPAEFTPTTDAEGRFRVDGLVPGVEYEVGLQRRNSPLMRLKEATLMPGEVRDLGDVKVSEPQ